MHETPPTDCPNYRFKELVAAGWWPLVASLDETSLVSPGSLFVCPEKLRTLVEFDNTLCFHLADIICGKLHFQPWLKLLAKISCRQAKIRLLDKQPYTTGQLQHGKPPATTNSMARSSSPCRAYHIVQKSRRGTRKMVIHAAESSTELPWMDLIRQHRHIKSTRHCSLLLLCGPGLPLSSDALCHLRIRTRSDFQTTTCSTKSITFASIFKHAMVKWLFSLFTWASSKYPLWHNNLHLCLLDLANTLPMDISESLQFPIRYRERSVNMLPTWYSVHEEHFPVANVNRVLHKRGFESIAWITTGDSKT